MPFSFLLCGCRHGRADTVIHQVPSTDEPPTADQQLFDLLNLKPWEPEDREKYDDQAVLQRIKECPEGVAAKYSFVEGNSRPVFRLPLFKAVALDASLETVTLMYRIYPPAIKDSGKYNNTPLHTACAYQARLEVIQFLLSKYPKAAKVKNSSGFTPLHNLCEYGTPDPETVELLIDSYPGALVVKNKAGKNPYQAALQTLEPDPRVLELLQKHTKRDASSTDPASSMEFLP